MGVFAAACAGADGPVVVDVASGPASDAEPTESTPNTAGSTTTTTGTTSTTSSLATTTTTSSSSSTTTTTTTTSSTTSTSATSTTSTSTTAPGPPTTACTSVAHISDSTGVYLWEARYVDGVANTMGERYRSVGVEQWVEDSSGGRAVRERVADWQTNALEVADAIRHTGFDGCWVVMIGTNDAANVAAGAGLGPEDRILQLLFVFGDDPVLWVDAATLRTETAYRNDNMRAWNDVLYRVADRYPNVQVLRWSDQVRPEWYISDGIHMGTTGRIWRAAFTAAALVEYFPA